MESFFSFILACYGFSYIVTQSYVMSWFRKLFKKNKYLDYLFNCITCFGFWAGLLITLFIDPTGFILLNGFIAAGCCNILFNLKLNTFE